MSECWRCGRAYPTDQYVFGPVCDRADCNRVKQALSDRFRWFWFKHSPPTDNHDPGRGSCWSPDGEFTGCRGYAESSLQTLVDSNRMREARS